jgi:adenylate cyclase
MSAPLSSTDPTPLPRGALPREHIVLRQTIARPPAERPAHDTIAGIAEWLVGSARHIMPGAAAIDELAWRLLAAGLPLLRLTLHVGTVHPQFLGTTMTWWRDTGETTEILIRHEVVDMIPPDRNPVRLVCRDRQTLRRRLDLPDDELDFDILFELRDRGGTDYLALPMAGTHTLDYMITYVTDRPGGFTPAEIEDLALVARRLTLVVDHHSQGWITLNVLTAYLGARTGPKVLAGQIRRGAGVELTAALWSSDLRGFTERSDRIPPDRMIAILNALFDAQAVAIHGHGGEILKFIGDGILAVFPVENEATMETVARDAIAAAQDAQAAVRGLADDPSMDGEPPLEIVIALHVGIVTYGNIGATDRLDFTVIGPAVNLVSRIEAVAKTLEQPIVVSQDFAEALGNGVTSLGGHHLRGLAALHELFAPA